MFLVLASFVQGTGFNFEIRRCVKKQVDMCEGNIDEAEAKIQMREIPVHIQRSSGLHDHDHDLATPTCYVLINYGLKNTFKIRESPFF